MTPEERAESVYALVMSITDSPTHARQARDLTRDLIAEAIAEERETGRARFFVTYPWCRSRLVEITDEVVDILLDLAKHDRHEDFMFLAGSSGVPTGEQGLLWEGTRRRLGL